MSKIYLSRDKEWLLNNYVNKKRKISTIARECNVDQGTINIWIHKFKIPLNKVDESQVLQAYKDGLSVEKIQVKFNLAPKSVYDILNKYDELENMYDGLELGNVSDLRKIEFLLFIIGGKK